MFSFRSSARVLLLLTASLLFPSVAGAQVATPDTGNSAVFTLVEHPEHVTTLDIGDTGKSAGDITVWGPDPLFDQANEVDTGALTYGSCLSLNAAGDNHCKETVLFAAGSTLEIQGIQRGSGKPSLTTIVGGSGMYLGATGTVLVDPADDYSIWTKTFKVVMPANNG